MMHVGGTLCLERFLVMGNGIPIMQYNTFASNMSPLYIKKLQSGLMFAHQSCHEIQSWSFGTHFFLFLHKDTGAAECA